MVIFLEQTGKVFQGLLFPALQLVGVDVVLRGDLSNRFFFFENFEHVLGFLCGGKASPHGFQSNLFLPVFGSKFRYPLKTCTPG